jgi:RHS repeat-associated protein
MSRKELANGVYTTYSYDAVGQVLTLVNRAPDDSVLSRFEYTYDARGLRTSMETIEGRWEYDYDEIGQLVGWTDPNLSRTDFEYDRLGNRLTETIDGAVTSYTVNNLNQYTQVGSKTYLYDLDGNLTRETDGSTLTNYAFNVENRLTSVTRGSQSWSYTYDALGNRVTATELGVTTRFVVDPIGYGNVVGEYQSSNLVARNVSGYGLVSRAEGGQASYYTFEAIGSTSEMTNAAGAVQAHYTYTPFGVPVVAQASPSNPYRFIGMYGIRRESNGLDWMRARSLLAISGRFLSHDPLQLGGGSVNYYPYVENQPTVLIDPLVYKVRMANVCVF